MAKHLFLLAIAIAAGLVVAAVSTISFGLARPQLQASAEQENGQGQSMKNGVGEGSMNDTQTRGSSDNKNNSAMSSSSSSSTSTENQQPSYIYALERKFNQFENGTLTVRAGGGGHYFPATAFFPQRAEIKVGERVTWINPTLVGEPHTVTFMTDKRYFAEFGSPFIVSNTTKLSSAIPGSNADPLVIPGKNGTNILVAANKRSLAPTVIDASGKVTYLAPGTTYKLDGTEKFVNSGWIWPNGQVPPGFAPINSFTVTFNKAGTYDYLCQVHPWMSGQVVVK